MQIRLLVSAVRDLCWFREYYKRVFPQGEKRARKQYQITRNLLNENPLIGRQITHKFRRVKIVATPFSLIYCINRKNKSIDIVRVWDERCDPEKLGE